MSSRVRVQCFAGYKVDERPVRFELSGNDYVVEEIVDRWYGPSRSFFKVVADDGNLYILSHPITSKDDYWELELFRETRLG